ncbi:hypothetical protein D3C71_1999180 [compost metagenome]
MGREGRGHIGHQDAVIVITVGVVVVGIHIRRHIILHQELHITARRISDPA